jgi:AraC-like DNA-binding protein
MANPMTSQASRLAQRTSSCTWIKSVLEMFSARGVDVQRLLEAAGIGQCRLENPDERFTADEVSRLWQLAVAWSGDATLGLDRELAARHINFDVLGYALASSPDLRHGFASLKRYMAILSDVASIELVPQDDDAWLVLGSRGFSLPVPRQRYAFGILALIVICQWLTRRPVEPLAVEFTFETPPELARYQEVFRCPLRFGQAWNRLLLPSSVLAEPLPSRNPSLRALHERVLATRMEALDGASVSRRVSEEIVRQMHLGEPRRDKVAARLAMTDRTLQRRLAAEDTSFQRLMDEARREMACQYLSEKHRTLAQVADLLGFVDQSNLFRACRRWFGEPPGQYRRRMLDVSEESQVH